MAVPTIVTLCITFLGLAWMLISAFYIIERTSKIKPLVAFIGLYTGAFMFVGGEIAFLIIWHGLV